MKKVYSVEGRVKIKNAKGTSDKDCKCDSWLKHWEKFSNKLASKCVVDGCSSNATVGAHVLRTNPKSDAYKKHLHIAPMCSSHNGMHGEEFYSEPNTTFVWGNVAETCGV